MSVELTKPVLFFDAVWDDSDLSKQADPYQLTQDREIAYFIFPIDLYGLPWTDVPAGFWPKDELISRSGFIASFQSLYVRISVTVQDGYPGDSIAFLVKDPAHEDDQGIFSLTHVEVLPHSHQPPILVAPTSTAINQHWLNGYDFSDVTGPEEFFQTLRRRTQIRILGAVRRERMRIRARLELIGGIQKTG